MTIAVGAVFFALRFIPLPGWRSQYAFDLPRRGEFEPQLLLDLGTVFVAFIIIEIVAWLVPPWRKLRTGWPRGRAKLDRAAIVLAVIYGAVKLAGFVMYLKAAGWADMGSAVLLWPLTGAAMVCAVVWMSMLIDHYGLGRGWSVLALVDFVDTIYREVRSSLQFHESSGWPLVFSACVVVLATLWILQLPKMGRAKWLPLPTTGVVPLMIPAALLVNLALGLVHTGGLSIYRPIHEPIWVRFWMGAGFALIIGVFCHWVYFGNKERHDNSGMGYRSLIASLAFLAVLVCAEQALLVREMWLSLPALVIVVAIVRDLVIEGRFRAEYGEVPIVASLSRMRDLHRTLEALAKADIPAAVRGQGHRVMLQFFGPYVPAQVMVPPERYEEALAVLSEDLRAVGMSAESPVPANPL